MTTPLRIRPHPEQRACTVRRRLWIAKPEPPPDTPGSLIRNSWDSSLRDQVRKPWSTRAQRIRSADRVHVNIFERLVIRTVGQAVAISGYASYAPLPGSSHTAARILATGLTFEWRLDARRDLAKVAALLSSPGSARTALPCEGKVGDDQHLVTITALRSRYSTLTPPWVDPYTGNVLLEYIDDKPQPDDIGLLDCYAATLLDLRRSDAEQIALRLLDSANGDTPAFR